jgi:hypothetical protein
MNPIQEEMTRLRTAPVNIVTRVTRTLAVFCGVTLVVISTARAQLDPFAGACRVELDQYVIH